MIFKMGCILKAQQGLALNQGFGMSPVRNSGFQISLPDWK